MSRIHELTPELRELLEHAEHRFHTDPTFYARCNVVSRELAHTGMSTRQIAWVLAVDDRTRAQAQAQREGLQT